MAVESGVLGARQGEPVGRIKALPRKFLPRQDMTGNEKFRNRVPCDTTAAVITGQHRSAEKLLVSIFTRSLKKLHWRRFAGLRPPILFGNQRRYLTENGMNITCPNRRCRCDFTGDESLVGRLVECTDCRSAFYFPHRGEDATEDLDEFVIFDLETTGTSHRSHEIIQIAALRLKAGRLVERDHFFSYVRAADSIGTFITSLTGITDADVRNAPTIRQALPEFSKFVGDAVLIAHNGKSFDRWFLKSACILNGNEPPRRKRRGIGEGELILYHSVN